VSKKYKILNDPYQKSLNNRNGDYYYLNDLIAHTPDGLIRVKGLHPIDNPLQTTNYNGFIEQEYTIVNGASIPWFAQWLIPKSGKWNRPSAFHDSGYLYGGLEFFINGVWRFIKMTRKAIDYLYLKLMESRSVKKYKRLAQYEVLKSLGWVTWGKYRKLQNLQ